MEIFRVFFWILSIFPSFARKKQGSWILASRFFPAMVMTYLPNLPNYLSNLSTWHSFLPDLRKWPFSKMLSTYLTNLPDLLTHLPDLLTLPHDLPTYLPGLHTYLIYLPTWATHLPIKLYTSHFPFSRSSHRDLWHLRHSILIIENLNSWQS